MTFHRLVAAHGSAEAALAELPRLAAEARVSGYRPCSPAMAEAEFTAARRAGLVPLFYGAPDYPPELAQLPDAPPLLWRHGAAEAVLRPMVALVGARNASSLGLRMAARLAHGLGEAGLMVVSGLARGIDSAAHTAALAQGSVAVLAGGADQIYPPENRDLAQRLRDTGALLSEMAPGTQAQARHFPTRNRLISGLALGVVVVEAAAQSGSMLTARTALDQGREVMAVPGHPVDPRAAGCNLMIRDGCTLVRQIDDILEAIGPALAAAEAIRARRDVASPLGRAAAGTAQAFPTAPPAAARGPNQLPPPEQLRPAPGGSAAARALAALATGGAQLRQSILARLAVAPLPEDQLSRDLALSPAALSPALVALELDGEIERRPGGLLTRLG